MIVVDEKALEVPGVQTTCWRDDPVAAAQIKNRNPRHRKVRYLMLHTVHGLKGDLKPGGRDAKLDRAYALSQRTRKGASWDATIDLDGSIYWQNDPANFCSWHGGLTVINELSFGIELGQDNDGTMYQATLDSLGKLLGVVLPALGVQMQVPWDHAANEPYAGRIDRLLNGGEDVVGLVGHRNAWVHAEDGSLVPQRGFGDPNSHAFKHLVEKHGYEKFDYNARQDLQTWRERQTSFGMAPKDADGVPLTQTVAMMKSLGYKDGIWVQGKTA